jgi:hypothetical protein
MRLIFVILPILLILPAATNVFAQTSIRAELDKMSLTTDEALTYKLIIISSERELPQPQVADFKDFALISQAQSSTFSFVKGTARTILVYAFILAPTKTGKFQIGTSFIKLKQKTLSTEVFEVEVKDGKSKLKPQKKSPIPEKEPQEPSLEKKPPESEEMPQYII